MYDCLRANKSTSAWGLEARVPFLDKGFLNVAVAFDTEWKNGMISSLLRQHAGVIASTDT